ncbi:hypothetical protein CEXT_238241 [Caerostris extrusa]|uniref:Uncharacterized protein n=1 Tax=Caerostris extrusa TaxID=172846 RepID=A0AAV4N003_CAEEX|nr:hypothetical protein CEXT_238241 [Caerostris extrusa]
MEGTLESLTMSDMGDMFSDGMATQSEADTKEEEEGLEPKDNSVFIVVNGLPEKEEVEVSENNNEPTTPNQVKELWSYTYELWIQNYGLFSTIEVPNNIRTERPMAEQPKQWQNSQCHGRATYTTAK